jgi:hypothetical protein
MLEAGACDVAARTGTGAHAHAATCSTATEKEPVCTCTFYPIPLPMLDSRDVGLCQCMPYGGPPPHTKKEMRPGRLNRAQLHGKCLYPAAPSVEDGKGCGANLARDEVEADLATSSLQTKNGLPRRIDAVRGVGLMSQVTRGRGLCSAMQEDPAHELIQLARTPDLRGNCWLAVQPQMPTAPVLNDRGRSRTSTSLN